MNATRVLIAPWTTATVTPRWLGLKLYSPMVRGGVLVDRGVTPWCAFRRCPHALLARGAACWHSGAGDSGPAAYRARIVDMNWRTWAPGRRVLI